MSHDIYDMNTPVPIAEYVDAHTGVRLTVRGDVLGHYTYELFWAEGDEIYNKEINAAIQRLIAQTGITQESGE